jgi:hypothetical protein
MLKGLRGLKALPVGRALAITEGEIILAFLQQVLRKTGAPGDLTVPTPASFSRGFGSHYGRSCPRLCDRDVTKPSLMRGYISEYA